MKQTADLYWRTKRLQNRLQATSASGNLINFDHFDDNLAAPE